MNKVPDREFGTHRRLVANSLLSPWRWLLRTQPSSWTHKRPLKIMCCVHADHVESVRIDLLIAISNTFYFKSLALSPLTACKHRRIDWFLFYIDVERLISMRQAISQFSHVNKIWLSFPCCWTALWRKAEVTKANFAWWKWVSQMIEHVWWMKIETNTLICLTIST